MPIPRRLVALLAAGLLTGSGAQTGRGQTVEWIRQFGTSDEDSSLGVSADGLGNIYITGYTGGSLGGPNAGNYDAIIAKYDAAGSLLWTRQFGTTTLDVSSAVSADGLGNVYISGHTFGSLAGPNAGDSDAFVAKYDADGSLQWTRQLGTAVNNSSSGVSADGLGNVYISGTTGGSLGGQPHAGYSDAFVAKYDAAGSLQWTRQLGTGEIDLTSAVSADGLGNVYISGLTLGSLGGQPHVGGNDAFVSKFDAAGALQWTRQLGTTNSDWSYGVSADALGNVYITGTTQGSLGGPHAGASDAFVAKYDAAGTLQWTRQLGTTNSDRSYGVSADVLGNVYISGYTDGSLSEPSAGGRDAFVAKYDAAGSLQWTRQLGTAVGGASSNGVSADGLGNVYFSGHTYGSLGGPNAGSNDAFLAKLFDPAVPNLPGDFNADGVVDGGDFAAWQRGESPDPLSAADLAAWKQNFGPPGTVDGAATVPEPAGAALLAALAAAGPALVRKGRRRAPAAGATRRGECEPGARPPFTKEARPRSRRGVRPNPSPTFVPRQHPPASSTGKKRTKPTGYAAGVTPGSTPVGVRLQSLADPGCAGRPATLGSESSTPSA